MRRRYRLKTLAATLLAAVVVPLVAWSVWTARADAQAAPPPLAKPALAPVQPAVGQVQVHVREGIGTLDSGMRTPMGAPVGVPCGTCHEAHSQPPFVQKSSELKDFHRGVKVAHGNQPCAACHSLEDRDRLHLADGRTIPFQEVVTLCSQCHGPQARDYAHGAHGGMNGYWNLAQGNRVRNSCVDCHAAHAPAFPHFTPVLKPRDRFLDDRSH